MPDQPHDPEPEPDGDSPPDVGTRVGAVTGWSRLRESLSLAWLRLTSRVQAGHMAIYLSVVSLIGVDAATVIIGSAAIWPVGIPFLILGLAAIYLIRRRVQNLRRNRDER